MLLLSFILCLSSFFIIICKRSLQKYTPDMETICEQINMIAEERFGRTGRHFS